MRTVAQAICMSVAATGLSSVSLADGHLSVEQQTETASQFGDVDAEAEFLKELHYSHEGFVRLYESLPKDEAGNVDWERAVSLGLIAPAAAAGEAQTEEMIMDLRVVIKFDDMLVKDVVFSHSVHTYWLDCSSCHPKIFKPEIASNRMTMKQIRSGQYCGVCHGVVAFPTTIVDAPNFRANCLRCHRAKRG